MSGASESKQDPPVIRMTPEGFGAFLQVLAGPPEPVREMMELIRRPAPWETAEPTGKS